MQVPGFTPSCIHASFSYDFGCFQLIKQIKEEMGVAKNKNKRAIRMVLVGFWEGFGLLTWYQRKKKEKEKKEHKLPSDLSIGFSFPVKIFELVPSAWEYCGGGGSIISMEIDIFSFSHSTPILIYIVFVIEFMAIWLHQTTKSLGIHVYIFSTWVEMWKISWHLIWTMDSEIQPKEFIEGYQFLDSRLD